MLLKLHTWKSSLDTPWKLTLRELPHKFVCILWATFTQAWFMFLLSLNPISKENFEDTFELIFNVLQSCSQQPTQIPKTECFHLCNWAACQLPKVNLQFLWLMFWSPFNVLGEHYSFLSIRNLTDCCKENNFRIWGWVEVLALHCTEQPKPRRRKGLPQ